MSPAFRSAPAFAIVLLLALATACGQSATFAENPTNVRSDAGATIKDKDADATANDGTGKTPNGEDSTAGDKNHSDDPSGNDGGGAAEGGSGGSADGGSSSDGGSADSGGSTGGSVDGGSTGGGATGGSSTGGSTGGSTSGSTDSGSTDSGNEGGVSLPTRLTRSMNFQAQTIGKGTVVKNLADAYLTSRLTLTRNIVNRTKQLTQVTRPQAVDNFEQGNSGAQESQAFDQLIDRTLDIVVVIDNSGSMTEEQTNMASKLAPLLSYVQDADWQIGVVTTDPDAGCLRKLIKKSDTNPAQLFSDAVTAGIGGSGNERGILQAVRALAGTCLTQPWIRSNSSVAVLIVSDEDNCSNNGSDCPGKDYASANYLYDYLTSIREPGKNARVYGLIRHPSQTAAQCSTAYYTGTIYADIISRTSGTWGSICAPDYGPTLSQISTDMKSVLNSKFTLTYTPDPASVRVFVAGVERTSGISVTGKVVELNPAPEVGAQIVINYRQVATPIKTSFALRYTPDASLLSVLVDDQPAAANSYTVNVAQATVDFVQAPAAYAKIVVSYTRNDQPLGKVFSMGEAIRAGSLTVKINGGATTAFTVVNSTGAVTFNSAPLDNAALEFKYQVSGEPVLRYPFTPDYEFPLNLEVTDTNSGATVGATYETGFININPADFIEGRDVSIHYDNIERQQFEVTLPADPLPGVSVVGGQVTCNDPAHLTVTGRIVQVDNCGFDSGIATVTVSYDYVLANHRSFDFNLENLPAENAFQEWSVWVDGFVRTDFTRQGHVISFAQDLPMGAVVKVQLVQEVR